MSSISMRTLARELNLKNKYNIVYGNVNGYILSFSKSDNNLDMFIDANLVELSPKLSDDIKDFITTSSISYDIDSYTVLKTGINLSFPDRKNLLSTIIEFAYMMINQLKLAGITGAELCSNCGKPVTDGILVKVGNRAHICDEQCAEKLSASKKKTRDTSKKHIFAGFCGAVIGSIIALAPWVYLNYFGYYSAPAAILVPLLAMLGYSLFGGRNCIGKAVIVFLISLLNYSLAAFGLVYYKVFAEWQNAGYIFTRSELLNTLFSTFTEKSELIEKFLFNQLIAGGIFILLGLIIAIPYTLKSRDKYTAIL